MNKFLKALGLFLVVGATLSAVVEEKKDAAAEETRTVEQVEEVVEAAE